MIRQGPYEKLRTRVCFLAGRLTMSASKGPRHLRYSLDLFLYGPRSAVNSQKWCISAFLVFCC